LVDDARPGVHDGLWKVERMQETPKATVKEIARLAEVSIGTVDRVLHNRAGVSPDTKRKIEEIVRLLGYKPDIFARQLSLNRAYVFRVVLPRAEQDSGYWSLCLGGIRRAAKSLAPYRITVRIDEFDRYDRAAYRALLDSIVAQPGDGLLVAPVLPDELLPALLKLDGKVPFVFFDGTVQGVRPLVAIGQDAFRAGYLAARMLSLLAEGRGPLVAVNTHPEDRHIKQRIAGYEAYFRDARRARGRRALVRECFDIERPEQSSAFLERLFEEEPEVAGILVANASGHNVGEWLVRRGAKDACAVVCWDLVPTNEAALRAGSLDCIVSQRPFDQGREGIDRLFRAIVRGEEGDTEVRVPIEVYFAENLQAEPPRTAG
jgi:LacI family transcriptional regulator